MNNNILYDNFKNYDLDTLPESKSSNCPCCKEHVDNELNMVAESDWYRKSEYYVTINWMEVYVCPNCNATFKLENEV